jgi:NAD(P)-dependent dehydrogenase (short-subunit alcohol dehydrogenase family)
MPAVLITGANRGLGFEFARQYAEDDWRVIATCRAPDRALELNALAGDVAIYPLDVTDSAATRALARRLEGEAIDVLIANAGIYVARSMTAANVDEQAWHESFAVNTIAPIVLAGAFLPHVARSDERKMIAVGSVASSVTSIKYGGNYAYRSSKAALHIAWRVFAFDHPEVIAALISPGRIRTGMNPAAPIDPAAATRELRRVIAGLARKDSGGFFRTDGGPAPL